MKDELHQYLDGERSRDALPEEVAAEAESWDALLEASGGLKEARAPGWIEERVMAAVSPAPEARNSVWSRLREWLFAPRTIQVRPATVGLAGAGLVVLLMLGPWPWSARPPAPPVAGGAAAASTVYIQFAYAAPDAESVAVAGDFNGWGEHPHTLQDRNGDGVWTARIPLTPGVHKYMFVVDGDRWVTDPAAERYIDDGFGQRNALIAVAEPRGRPS